VFIGLLAGCWWIGIGPKPIDSCAEKPDSGAYYLHIDELPAGPMCDRPGIMVEKGNDGKKGKCLFYTCQKEVLKIGGTLVDMAYIECADAKKNPKYAKYLGRICK